MQTKNSKRKKKGVTRVGSGTLVRPPFKHGQIIRNKITGDIMRVMTATKLGVSATPCMVLGVFIHPAGYENYEVA
jgi:hypothetical protein